MHKNNRFTNKTTIGRTKRPLINYEFAAGFPETTTKAGNEPKTDQGAFQLDQNLNYLQNSKSDVD